MNYIKIADIPEKLNINKGDKIFISSDIKKIIFEAIRNDDSGDLNTFIARIIDVIGSEGTLIFPTYNWDFCKGVTFDYYNTPSQTGSLGTVALKRKDFKRSKHPLYSFAVWGKDQEKICNMDNISSYGIDSPFAYFRDMNVKNIIINVPLQHCFTYAHFVEEMSGIVKYRYMKDFTANYKDENEIVSERTYSMFVRDLNLDVNVTIDPIEYKFIDAGAEKLVKINSSDFIIIEMGKVYPIIMDDIYNNSSRLLTTYLGQPGF